jgi:hypothetical protein
MVLAVTIGTHTMELGVGLRVGLGVSDGTLAGLSTTVAVGAAERAISVIFATVVSSTAVPMASTLGAAGLPAATAIRY